MPRLLPEDLTDNAPAEEELVLAVVAYVPVLCLLPALSKSDSEFARAHGRQGVVLFLAEILAGMAAFVPAIGPWLAVPSMAVLLWASCLGARRAMARERWKMPIVGAIADHLRALAP